MLERRSASLGTLELTLMPGRELKESNETSWRRLCFKNCHSARTAARIIREQEEDARGALRSEGGDLTVTGKGDSLLAFS
eukprot:8702-Heterococcus_DN1.PRE.1